MTDAEIIAKLEVEIILLKAQLGWYKIPEDPVRDVADVLRMSGYYSAAEYLEYVDIGRWIKVSK